MDARVAAERGVAFGLGANLGDAAAALQGALDELAGMPGLTLTTVSSVYETEPVGGPEQPRYLNAVVVGRTVLSPTDVLCAAQGAEQAFGRTREVRWGPRTLDVDVLVLGDLRSEDPVLTLPHPRAHERAFVLVPWAQVDPQAQVPGRGSVADLLARLLPSASGSQAVRRRDDLPLVLPTGPRVG